MNKFEFIFGITEHRNFPIYDVNEEYVEIVLLLTKPHGPRQIENATFDDFL